MKRRALLLGLAASGCFGARSRPAPLARSLLTVARSSAFASEEEASWSADELERIAQAARTALARAPTRSPVAVVNELLFGSLGFVREVDDTDLTFVLLPGVLERRRGSCVGLGTLFLALADALGWSASGVMMPGHFYVRVQKPGQACNVELLRGGEVMPDAWYGWRFPVPGGSAREYARPLSPGEVLGVVEYNVGNERLRQRRLPEARAAFTRATQAFPELAEAHASLGAVEQRLGNLNAAADGYRKARAVNPNLPGVEHNLALLADERAAAFTP